MNMLYDILYNSLVTYSTLVITYFTCSLLGYNLDKSHILKKYKIKNRTKKEYHELYVKLAPRVTKNVCIYSYPFIFGTLYINKLYNVTSNEYYDFEYKIFNILNLVEFLYYLCASLIITDIVFYTTHYLMHTKYFYKYHKIHHEIIHPVSISALYAHPVDFYITNLTPISMSLLILNCDMFTWQILIAIQIAFSMLISHGGYKNVSENHTTHHIKMIYNYGFQGFRINMDYLLGTRYIKPVIEIVDKN